MGNNSALHVKTVITGVIAALTAIWGWFGWLVIIWVGLMLADWLVGSAVASMEGRWSSAKLRAGAWHKGGMIVIVCVALVADWHCRLRWRHGGKACANRISCICCRR